MPKVNITTSGTTWDAQNNNVERLMDHAAYSSAHPDDTLVFVGPPRLGGDPVVVAETGSTAANVPSSLSAIGMMQNFALSQQKPFQPMMAIGSGRQFFLGGKAQGSAQIGRLFVNAKSLLSKLYSMYDITGANFKEAAHSKTNTDFFINLDSELFLIPFGLGCVIRDKSQTTIGSFYLELCVIPTYNMGVTAGQSMIMESVSLLFDRIVPLDIPTKSLNGLFGKWNNLLTSGGNGYTETDLNTGVKATI